MHCQLRYMVSAVLLIASCTPAEQKKTGVNGTTKNADTIGLADAAKEFSIESVEAIPEDISNSGNNLQEASIADLNYRQVWQWFHPAIPETQSIPLKTGVWQTVLGRMGTEITINTNEFEITAQAGQVFKLILLEALDKAAMIKSGVQTICSGRLLESAGAFYLALTDGKRKYNLKPDGKLWIKHPVLLSGNYGIFYSGFDKLGRMLSESGRTRVKQGKGLLHDDHYQTFHFTTDSAVWDAVHLFRLPGNSLQWEKLSEYNQTEFSDTIDYHEFSTLIFKSLGVQTRNFMITLGAEMVPIENIDAAAIHYRRGEGEGLVEIHYRSQNGATATTHQNFPTQIAQTGWIQIARYLNSPKTVNITYSCAETGNVSAGLIYLISQNTNTVVMQPWIPENGRLQPGTLNNIPAAPCKLVSVILKEGTLWYATAQTGRSEKIELQFTQCPPGFGLDADLYLP